MSLWLQGFLQTLDLPSSVLVTLRYLQQIPRTSYFLQAVIGAVDKAEGWLTLLNNTRQAIFKALAVFGVEYAAGELGPLLALLH